MPFNRHPQTNAISMMAFMASANRNAYSSSQFGRVSGWHSPGGWQHGGRSALDEQERTQASKPQTRPSPALTSPLLLKEEPALGDASAPSPSWNSVISSAATAVVFTNRSFHNSNTNTSTQDWCALSTKICRYPFTTMPSRQQRPHAVQANKTAIGMCMTFCSTSKIAWIAWAFSLSPQRKSWTWQS